MEKFVSFCVAVTIGPFWAPLYQHFGTKSKQEKKFQGGGAKTNPTNEQKNWKVSSSLSKIFEWSIQYVLCYFISSFLQESPVSTLWLSSRCRKLLISFCSSLKQKEGERERKGVSSLWKKKVKKKRKTYNIFLKKRELWISFCSSFNMIVIWRTIDDIV